MSSNYFDHENTTSVHGGVHSSGAPKCRLCFLSKSTLHFSWKKAKKKDSKRVAEGKRSAKKKFLVFRFCSQERSLEVTTGNMVIKQWISTDEVVDRVNAMRRQEETSYACRSYFPEVGGESADIRLNVTWREKICQWSYNVVDQ